MPKQYYAYEKFGVPRVVIAWDRAWQNFTIHVNQQLIEEFDNGAHSLKLGRSFQLTDGSTLFVQVNDNQSPPLTVTRNGEPLVLLMGPYERQVRRAVNSVFLVAVVNLAVAIGSFFVDTPHQFDVLALTMPFCLIAGILLLPLSYWAYTSTHKLILPLALFTYLLDIMASYFWIVQSGGTVGFIGVLVHVWLLIYMAQGMIAQRHLI